MQKIVQRQLDAIMAMETVTLDMSNENFLQVNSKEDGAILASIWETAKGDLMDYELYTDSDDVLKAAGLETFGERIAREIAAKKAGL